MRASSCTPSRRLAFAVRYTTESSGRTSPGDKGVLVDAVSRRTPQCSNPLSESSKLDSPGCRRADFGPPSGSESRRCIPGRRPRAGWPSLLALKPGERSRDRLRLTMVREIHTTREGGLYWRPSLSIYLAPPNSFGTAVYGARRIAAVADVGGEQPLSITAQI